MKLRHAQQPKSVSGVCSQMLLVGIERVNERREIIEELLFQKILEVRPNLERFSLSSH